MRISIARLNLRPVTRLSAAFGLALTFASLPAAAQQWTAQQRAACEPDAMRLCNQYIPDVHVSQPACPLTGGISAPPAAPYSTAARKRR
jgi:hypothetical protein